MRKSSVPSAALCVCCALLSIGRGSAQDWTTLGNDAQRSSWLRSDSKISIESVQTGDFQFLWKAELDNQARLESALTAPVLLDFLISHKGFRSLAFVGGSEGNVFAIDTDLARMEWERRLGESLAYPAPTPECPGGMTAGLTRPTTAALPALAGLIGSGARLRSPGVSGVGKPGEGAVTLAAAPSAASSQPPPPKRNPRQQPPEGRKLRGLTVVYALPADGRLRTMLVSNGYDHEPPIRFLPEHANARGLIVVDGVAYVATSNGCGGVPDGVWALDLESKQVTSWKSGSGSVAGEGGLVIAPDGTVYAATADGRVVALEAKTLKQKAVHHAMGVSFVSSPVLIDINDRDYLAVAAADGSIRLLDGADLAGAPLSKTAGGGGAAKFANGGLATWRDSAGTTWLLSPTEGAVAAWKIVDKDGELKFESGWTSSGMRSPLTPIVVNGVVFAAARGSLQSAAPAILYALDGASGKTLWDSGRTITAAAPAGGLSAGGGRVYLGAHDGAFYAFGFPIEH